MAVKRKVAGVRVHSLMEELSSALMADEDRAKAAMEGVLLAGSLHVAPLVTGWHGSSTGPALDVLVAGVRGRAVEALEGTRPAFQQLMGSAMDKALASMLLELQVCESTLSKKYVGLSLRAVAAVSGAKDVLQSLALVQYAAVDRVLPWFLTQLRAELSLSSRQEEAPDLMLARVISPTPVKTLQHSGRGLWWKLLEECNRVAREVEFAVVNAAREEAMMQFNRIGEKL